MNDARFSMRLPRETLAFAQGYAARYNMTLTDLFLRYVERLKTEIATKTTKKRYHDFSKYRGIIKPALTDQDVDDLLWQNITEKYA